jgi:ribulose-phosphate 3-epimerase
MSEKLPIEIIPAILPEDFEHLENEIGHVHRAAKIVQIDVTDGKFAPSTTWPYNDEQDENWRELLNQHVGLPYWEELDFEVDLMVVDQIAAARDWISAGVTRIIPHIEALKDGDKAELFELKNQYNVQVVFALNPNTPNEALDEYLDIADGVQFMGNDNIGYHGMTLDARVYDKVRALRAKMDSLGRADFPIAIDIGVTMETAPKLRDAGVTRFAAGSLTLNAADPVEVVAELSELLK